MQFYWSAIILETCWQIAPFPAYSGGKIVQTGIFFQTPAFETPRPSPILSYPPYPALCNLDAAGKLTCDDISEGGTPNVQPPRRFFQKHGVTDLALNFKLNNRASEEGQPLAKFLNYFKLVIFSQKYI